jgi:hypothetical protein
MIEKRKHLEQHQRVDGLSTFVDNWLSAYRNDLGIREIRRDMLETPTRKLVAWYETSEHIIDIAAWEQGCCLSIMIVDKRTGCMVYAVDGCCENKDEVHARLDAFARWLSAHQHPAVKAAILDFPRERSAA